MNSPLVVSEAAPNEHCTTPLTLETFPDVWPVLMTEPQPERQFSFVTDSRRVLREAIGGCMQGSYEFHENGSEMFWGELPPSEHLLQIYDSEQVFLDTLEGFVTGGLRSGDGVIVIATSSHLASLEERILSHGFDTEAARFSGQLTALQAEDVLAQFLVNGWPDEDLFHQIVSGLLARAGGSGRKVRAFGEMVAVLWACGNQGATVRLEFLWHQLCQKEGFSLFCAYPKTGFTGDAAESINELCTLHSKVIPGVRRFTPKPGAHQAFTPRSI